MDCKLYRDVINLDTATQWDTGVRIKFTDVPVGLGLHVWLKLSGDDGSTVGPVEEIDPCERDENTGDLYFPVQDALLQTAGTLLVSCYATAKNAAATLTGFSFAVSPREKPEGYICAPIETKMYYRLAERLQTLENLLLNSKFDLPKMLEQINDHKHSGEDITSGMVDRLFLPAASTRGKGIVQLTNAVDSADETLAASALALKNTNDTAAQAARTASVAQDLNEYAQSKINEIYNEVVFTVNGITPVNRNVQLPVASALNRGIVSLSNSIASGETDVAATSAAVKAVNDRISAPVKIANDVVITTSNTMAYTTVSVTIPANCWFSVTATARYEDTPPVAVGFFENSASDTVAAKEIQSAARGFYNAVVPITGFTGTEKTFYVFAQYKSGGVTGRISVDGFYKTT